MRETTPFGGAREHVSPGGVILMQRVIQPSQHASRVAERRMFRDALDAFAVDPHLAPIIEAVEEFLAGVRTHGRRLWHRGCHVAPIGAAGCFTPAESPYAPAVPSAGGRAIPGARS